MPCPDYPASCRAPDSMQRPLTPGEQAAVTEKGAAFAGQARQCSYCGLVYVPGNPPRLLGYFKDTFEAAPAYKSG